MEIDRGLIAMEIFSFCFTWLLLLIFYRSNGWWQGKVVRVSFFVTVLFMAIANLFMYSVVMKAAG